ncbi:DUF5076 domain-containing protein [Brevundimonas sp. FT23028]|uniref:DUF5076 domain-containing protein n=1 Tax=Brevundimonas sp. FT23028 TaxID=3393748 RepID=UPI003B58B091
MSGPDEFHLKVPDSIAADPEAVEVIRIWWSQGEPVMSVKPAFNNPAQFGELLAIAARHMAYGYAVRHGHNQKEAYNRILQGLSETIKADNIATVAEPTAPSGSVQ